MTRLLLVLALVALFALSLWGMRRGWLARAARQGDFDSPPVPPKNLGAELLAPLTGLYVGSTTAGSWQDRIVAGGMGMPADATARLYPQGLVIERQASAPVFVPAGCILEAGLATGLAGKVVGAGGLLVVRWRLAGEEIDTGLRADDKARYPQWVAALKGLVTS